MVFGKKKDKKRKPASNELLTEKLMELENRFNSLVMILQQYSPALKLYFAQEELRKQKYIQQTTAQSLQPTQPSTEDALKKIQDGQPSPEAKPVLKI